MLLGGKTVWKRVGIAFAGGAVVAFGIALIPLPGPGTLLILAGLGILATEFLWARRTLTAMREKIKSLKARGV